jgi:hypothetical protein
VENHHLQKCVGSRQEFAHDDLENRLALELFFFSSQFDVKLADKGVDLFLLGALNRVEDFEDRVQDELIEGSL